MCYSLPISGAKGAAVTREKNVKTAILVLQIIGNLLLEMSPIRPRAARLRKMSDQELRERIRAEQDKGNYLSIYTNEHHRRHYSAEQKG